MKIYADSKYTKYLTKKLRRYYKEKEPHVEHVPNGIIANEHQNGFGVFDKNYKFVKSSVQNHKGHKGQFVPKFNHDSIPYVDADAVFLCHMGKNGFGHFLVEYINRAWCLMDKKYRDMKIVLVDEINAGKIKDYVYVLLGLLGVKPENIILLDKTTQFRNVFVPTPAFDLSAYWTDSFRDMFDCIASGVPDSEKYEKIYMSKILMEMHPYGEKSIQDIFAKNGYKVICPETLPLTEQIALVKNCKYLAGCAGTPLHLALFMKPGGIVYHIKRNTVLLDNADTQYAIDMCKGLDSVFIAGSMETQKTDHFSCVPQVIGMTKYMKQFFDENGFKYTKSDLKNLDKEFADYQKAVANCCVKKDEIRSFKRAMVNLMACFVPGRIRRNKFRSKLQKILRY